MATWTSRKGDCGLSEWREYSTTHAACADGCWCPALQGKQADGDLQALLKSGEASGIGSALDLSTNSLEPVSAEKNSGASAPALKYQLPLLCMCVLHCWCPFFFSLENTFCLVSTETVLLDRMRLCYQHRLPDSQQCPDYVWWPNECTVIIKHTTPHQWHFFRVMGLCPWSWQWPGSQFHLISKQVFFNQLPLIYWQRKQSNAMWTQTKALVSRNSGLCLPNCERFYFCALTVTGNVRARVFVSLLLKVVKYRSTPNGAKR